MKRGTLYNPEIFEDSGMISSDEDIGPMFDLKIEFKENEIQDLRDAFIRF